MIRLKIDYWRQERGLSQGTLARLANVDENTLKRILRNPSSSISTATLDKIATALNVHPGELIEWQPGTPHPQQH